jgi:hypothetical protein
VQLRDAEVEHLHDIANARDLREKHVVGLDVSMNDPRAMRGRERRERLRRDPRRAHRRQRALAGDHPRERRALEALHHHERNPVVHPEVRHRDDVRMPERRRSVGLALKPRDRLHVLCVRAAQDLHRDVSAEPILHGLVHRPHTARAQRPDDAIPVGDAVVGAEFVAI